MKKIALFLMLVTTINACSIDNDGESYHSEIIAVDSYVVPEKFVLDKEYEIKLKYKRPSDCYTFQGIYYDKVDSTRTIAIQTKVMDKQTCNPLTNDPLEVSFKFTATEEVSYIFKFYKGNDSTGKNIFEEVTIPVVTE